MGVESMTIGFSVIERRICRAFGLFWFMADICRIRLKSNVN